MIPDPSSRSLHCVKIRLFPLFHDVKNEARMVLIWFFCEKCHLWSVFTMSKNVTFFCTCLKFVHFLRCFHGTVVLSGWSPSFALFFVRDHPDQDDLICFSFWNLRYFLCVIILLGMISFILVFEIKLQLSSCDHLLISLVEYTGSC